MAEFEKVRERERERERERSNVLHSGAFVQVRAPFSSSSSSTSLGPIFSMATFFAAARPQSR